MDHSNKELDELVSKGKAQGYLTYDQVNDYLPDEAVSPAMRLSMSKTRKNFGAVFIVRAPCVVSTLAALYLRPFGPFHSRHR